MQNAHTNWYIAKLKLQKSLNEQVGYRDEFATFIKKSTSFVRTIQGNKLDRAFSYWIDIQGEVSKCRQMIIHLNVSNSWFVVFGEIRHFLDFCRFVDFHLIDFDACVGVGVGVGIRRWRFWGIFFECRVLARLFPLFQLWSKILLPDRESIITNIMSTNPCVFRLDWRPMVLRL